MRIHKEHKTKLYRTKALFKNLRMAEAGLWNIAPPWPGTAKAKLDEAGLTKLMCAAYQHSAERAHLVLWMPASSLHQSAFDPLAHNGPWTSVATIISGSNPVHIGYVYARSRTASQYWGSKLILDSGGSRGSSSSVAMKFLLTQLGIEHTFVVEPFAHRSAALAIWSRRLNYDYIGYTRSKKTYRDIVKALAQQEIPGIQLGLPA